MLYHIYVIDKLYPSRKPFLAAGWLNAMGLELYFHRVRKVWIPEHYQITIIKEPKV